VVGDGQAVHLGVVEDELLVGHVDEVLFEAEVLVRDCADTIHGVVVETETLSPNDGGTLEHAVLVRSFLVSIISVKDCSGNVVQLRLTLDFLGLEELLIFRLNSLSHEVKNIVADVLGSDSTNKEGKESENRQNRFRSV